MAIKQLNKIPPCKTSASIDFQYKQEILYMVVNIRGDVNNYPQCSCICVSVSSTVVLRSIAMRGFLVIISAQV
jgi:hypothetical protein